jgi:HlyD family secretion protein
MIDSSGDAEPVRTERVVMPRAGGMDIARPEIGRRKRRNRIIYASVGVLVLAVLSVLIAQLEPAPPSVEKSRVWPDTVKHGEMLRQVRGNGTLVPEQIQYVQAETDGRIERILVLAGSPVQADTILLELSNPELKETAFQAEWQLKAAEAERTNRQVTLENDRLGQAAIVASLKLEYNQARLEAEADEALAAEKLIGFLIAKRSRSRADELKSRLEIEEKRLEIKGQAAAAQLQVQQAELERLRATLQLRRNQVAALQVRAGTDGVVKQIGDLTPLQIGQRIQPSSTLAKIVQPSRLKAEIRIPEVLVKDVALGQPAVIDWRNGEIKGEVVRVDPAPQNGTVLVDIKLFDVPKGVRPDLSVDGTIETARLVDVLYVARPMQVQPESKSQVFKLVKGGSEAVRVPVEFGRSSPTVIEIVSGLNVGDEIIVSDMSAWDSFDRLRIAE